MARSQTPAIQLERVGTHAKIHTTKLVSTVKRECRSLRQTAKTWEHKCLQLLGPLSLDLFNLILLTSIFIVTIVICSSTFKLKDGIANAEGKGPRLTASYGIGASTGLAIVRILQGSTSYYAALVFVQSLEALQWALAGNNAGTRLLTTLVLAPSTSVLGLINYVGNHYPSRPGKATTCLGHIPQFLGFFRMAWNNKTSSTEKWTAIIRMLYILAIIPLAGLALFVNVSILPIYTAQSKFNVIAGIGAFNASLVAPTINYTQGSLSYSILSLSSALIDNPQYSVRADSINCTETDGAVCDSYIFPGGVQTVLPSPTELNTSQFIIVYDSPAAQFEFKRYPNSIASLTGKDCSAYGNGRSPVGVELCIAADNALQGALQIDLYLCSKGVTNGTCLPKDQNLNMSLTASVYQRRATTVSSIVNNSIIAVSELETPRMMNFSDEDILGLRTALGWLLNYTAAGLPPSSSLAYQLWNNGPGPTEHDWALEVTETLQNALGFALWFFTENNYGNVDYNNAVESKTPSAYLPSEFQTTAAYAGSYLGFVIDKNWFIAYAILQALPILASWGVLIWFLWTGVERVKASSFPLIDFKYRLKLAEEGVMLPQDLDQNAKVIAALDGKIANVI